MLPSQPTSAWREQVGLPIVEGLSYGCTIVTTTETGLAGWLSEHRHRVLPADANEAQLAAAIIDALRRPVRGRTRSAAGPGRPADRRRVDVRMTETQAPTPAPPSRIARMRGSMWASVGTTAVAKVS